MNHEVVNEDWNNGIREIIPRCVLIFENTTYISCVLKEEKDT